MLTHLFFLCFAEHPLSNLFDLATKVDGSMYLHFQILALLINRKNILEQPVLIPGGDRRTLYSVIFTTIFGGGDRIIFKRLNLVPCTLSIILLLLIQDDPLNCSLVLLNSTYIGNRVIAFVDISPLLGLYR